MNTLLPNSPAETLVKNESHSVLMILGGAVAWRWAVPAERKSLEMVARPLTFIDID
jgi:hypothetical protein